MLVSDDIDDCLVIFYLLLDKYTGTKQNRAGRKGSISRKFQLPLHLVSKIMIDQQGRWSAKEVLNV